MKARESIQVRLRRVILLPCIAVLVIAVGSFSAYEAISFRRSHLENISTVAEVIAVNSSSSVAFDDRQDAQEVLSSLIAEPNVVRAFLFTSEGQVFASHISPGYEVEDTPVPGEDGVRYIGDRLVAVLPLGSEHRLGTLYLEATLAPLYQRLGVIGTLAFLVLAASFGLAYFLSAWLQRRVTKPLLELAKIASRVSESRDYSLRAARRTEDEIGGLTAAFNDMLDEISRRDQALRQSAQRLQLALEASSTGTWDWDFQNDVISWDDHLHRLFGIQPGEFSGTREDFFKRIHPEDRPGVERIIAKALEKGREFYAEYRISRPDGTVRWMVSRGRGLTDASGRPTRTSGVTIDVTESKKAEQALRESEDRFRTLADAAPVMIWTSDLTKGGDYFNKAWLKFTGRTLEQELGEGWFEGIHPDDREACRRTYGEAFEAQREFEMEYRLRRHDGEYRVIRDHGIPRLAPGGTFRGFIGSCIDITDIRQAQTELERRVESRTAALEETNRELEAFTYSVSHDLRAPLRHINSYAQVLSEDFGPELNEEAREYIRRIRLGAQNMGMLVDDLLNLARIGRQDLVLFSISLNALVDDVLRDLKADTAGREIEWRIADLGELKCDPGLMKQVFVNLISNAVKYTRPKPAAIVEIGKTEISEKPVYFVRDNGVGFDMKYADKLFGVFQRLHRAEDFEGTGVGLALVERIIRRHGGRIWAEAAPNQGATFYFTLKT